MRSHMLLQQLPGDGIFRVAHFLDACMPVVQTHVKDANQSIVPCYHSNLGEKGSRAWGRVTGSLRSLETRLGP